ncbi:MAG: transcriptional regulator, AraC family [Bryobacterales bacterium]|nr:transcriptional regulator, AraC family [Bryobacterales bacterium]
MTRVDPSLETNQRRIKALLIELTTGEGLRPTSVDGVKLARADRNVPRTPVLYEPSIYIVASGRKKGYIGDRRVVYDDNNYLVLSVPLPFECETEVGEGEPLLGVSVRMEMSLISELATKMDVRRQEAADADGCIRATRLDARMSDAIVRLLECLRSPVDAAVLGPGIVREITYHGLCGPQGSALFAMLARNGPLAQIHAVLHRMHTRYTEPLNVTRMAEEIGMSVSAFHHNFKAVTANSPLQYLKSVRLHKARLLIMHHGLGAALAADRVGYESASQFSREFKRFFGNRPMEESKRIRESIGITSPTGARAEPM